MTNYLLIGVGAFLLAMQMAVLCRFIYQSIRHRRYKPTSGVPLIGTLLLSIGLANTSSFASFAWTPICLEALVTIVAWLIVRYVKPSPIATGADSGI